MPLPPPPSECGFRRSLRAGFTLLELSIVLVIIGLLIGGIFVGQSLIHNAQLNAVITEFNRYQTAVQSFKQQYQALPGDMNNATSFWGIAGGTGSDAACSLVASTTAVTCNGNGDGQINGNGTHWGEIFRSWQHLSNAKMIDGSYTGSTTGSAANTSTPGLNVPLSRFAGNVGWSLWYSSDFGGGAEGSWFNADYGTGHVFILGLTNPGNVMTSQVVLTSKDTWSIDKKLDDGKPAQGNVMSGETPNCTNAANLNDLGTTYKLTTTPSCVVVFLANF